MTTTIAVREDGVELMAGRNGGTLRRGGPGGYPETTKEFYRILREKSPELAVKLVQIAMKGNVAAMTLALSYAVGKPTDKLELSGPNGGPLEFTDAVSDHEKRALRDAILRELDRVEERELVPA